MRRSRLLDGDVKIMGARFPRVTVGLAAATLIATILAKNVPGFLEFAVMPPASVWNGQVWRLLTWTFLEFQPLSLIFACFTFLFFGRDLAYSWGAAAFLRVCAGIVLGSAIVTCLIARLFWPGLLELPYWSAWALGESLIIAYATVFPARQILAYFVIPVGGRNLALLTVAGTIVFALLSSVPFFVPHFVAQGLMYAYVRGYTPRTLWLRLKLRGLRFSPSRRPSHLRPVERGGEPPRWLH